MKNRLFKLLIFLLLISVLVPSLVKGVQIDNPLTSDTFQEFIYKLIDFIFWLAIAIAPIMIIVAGFYFITAMGDPEKVKIAKQIILWTLIGLLIIFCAKGLIKLFEDIFLQP